MKSLFTAKSLIAASVALGAIGLASAAHARSDVILSIGLNSGYGYVQPAPVYVQPQPVYVQPQPVYAQPRHEYAQTQPVYYGHDRRWERRWERRGAWGDADRDGVPNAYDRDSRFYDGRVAHRQGGWRDADRDGVANRYDRAPGNPYRY